MLNSKNKEHFSKIGIKNTRYNITPFQKIRTSIEHIIISKNKEHFPKYRNKEHKI